MPTWRNNTPGWQWVAGCGADAAPYFRIFNPVNQGEKFDPDGDYVRRWVPELAKLPERWVPPAMGGPGSGPGCGRPASSWAMELSPSHRRSRRGPGLVAMAAFARIKAPPIRIVSKAKPATPCNS